MARSNVHAPMNPTNSRPRSGSPELVVLHETGLPIGQTIECLRRPIGTGYHYLIGRDLGTLYLTCPLNRYIWAARPSYYWGVPEVDPVAVHVALESPTDPEPSYTPAQYETLAYVLAALGLPYVLHRDIHTGIQVREDPRGFESGLLPQIQEGLELEQALPPQLAGLLYTVTGSYDLAYLRMPDPPPLLQPVIDYYGKHRYYR